LGIILGDSKIELPKIDKLYDVIHIDGDHTYENAKIDMDNSIKLLKPNGIIIFDDTNLEYLNKICNEYINMGLLIEYQFGKLDFGKYKHRFLQKV